MSPLVRRRLALLVALAVVIAIGIASRLRATGFFLLDKSLGDALYAVAAYLAFSLIAPRARVLVLASVALGACTAIELFQATGIPAQHADLVVVRWLVGTTFSVHDLACYVVGVAAAALVDARTRSRVDDGESTGPR